MAVSPENRLACGVYNAPEQVHYYGYATARQGTSAVSSAIASTAPATRDTRFGYVCGRCSRCCHGMRIQLNPYEVARLARHRGLTTSAFARASTRDGHGVELTRNADGACSLLGETGCTVHADRPLVCRLYPLGRTYSPEHGETFGSVVPHPETIGRHHDRGTIGGYLDEQGAEPFIAAADAYLGWLNAALARLRAVGQGDREVAAAMPDFSGLLDMDSTLAAHGEQPDDIEARKDLHLALLHRHLVPAGGEFDHGN